MSTAADVGLLEIERPTRRGWWAEHQRVRRFLGHGGVVLSFAWVLLMIVFALACFVGFQVVWGVSHALHTPLMAITNAISGIIIIDCWYTPFHGAASVQENISHCNAAILPASLAGHSLPALLAAYIMTAPDCDKVVGPPGPAGSTSAGMRPAGLIAR